MHAFATRCLERRDFLPDHPIWKVPRPPERLFIQGDERSLELLSALPERGLAVVGTRSPSARSLQLVRRELARIQGSGLVVVSGFARGIDTAAHRAALEADLPTIAILGAGLDIPYPRENQSLRTEILKRGGLLVSELEPGLAPHPGQFILRNRLIAAWTQATWIVEAGVRSGALNTARWARDCDRLCLATPCFPGEPAFAGNQQLLDSTSAIPFWGSQSLGACWLALATWSPQLSLPRSPSPGTLATEEPATRALGAADAWLLREVSQACARQGGITLESLLDRALEEGLGTEEIFLALGRQTRSGGIRNSGQVLSTC